MIKLTDRNVKFVGTSGKEYQFDLYSFDDFNDVKGVFDPQAALYVFGKLTEDQTLFSHIYMGETDNLHARFSNHHKETCIRQHAANSIGVCKNDDFNEEDKRLSAEKDILGANNFPCNEANN